MSLHDRIGATLRGENHTSHADRNKQHLEALREAKERILTELSAKEAVEFIFKEFPAAGVRKSLAIHLDTAENMDDLKQAARLALNFKNIHECNAVGSHDRITESMSNLVNSINKYLHLATHEDSEGGAKISESERMVINKIITKLEGMIADLHNFMDSKAEVVQCNS